MGLWRSTCFRFTAHPVTRFMVEDLWAGFTGALPSRKPGFTFHRPLSLLLLLPPSLLFFSFHFLQFLVFFSSSSSLFPLLIWSRQTRDGYSRTTSIRTTPPSLSNRFVNSCKDSSFGIDTIFFTTFAPCSRYSCGSFLGLTMMMHGPRARGEY